MTKPQATLAGGGHPEFQGIAWKQGWLRPTTEDERSPSGYCKLREPTDEEKSAFQNACKEPHDLSICDQASVDSCKREASRYAYDPSFCQSVDSCKKKYTAEYFYDDCMKTDFGPLLSRPKCIDLQPTSKITQQVIPTRKTVKVVSPSTSPSQITPVLSTNPTTNSTPSATQSSSDKKMSRPETFREIMRLIRSLISSLFRKDL